MKHIDYHINLNLHAEGLQVFRNVQRGDKNTVRIIATFSEDGKPYPLNDPENNDLTVVFAAVKPDGTFIYDYDHRCTIDTGTIDTDKNAVIYELPLQATAAAGAVVCQFKLIDSQQIKASPKFCLNVTDNPYDEQEIVLSSEGFIALTSLISSIDDALAGKVDKTQKIADIALNGNISAGDLYGAMASAINPNNVNPSTTFGYKGQFGVTSDATPKPVYSQSGAVGDWIQLAKKSDIPNISGKADKATTLSGYGIADAYTKTEADERYLQSHQDISGKADIEDIPVYLRDLDDGDTAIIKYIGNSAPPTSATSTAYTVPCLWEYDGNLWFVYADTGTGGQHLYSSILLTQDITVKENTSNKVDTIDSSANNTKYPSALAVKNYVDSSGYEFVSTIPANADHSKRFVLPDGYIYTWQDGTAGVTYNANTGIINQRPNTGQNYESFSAESGMLTSDLIPWDQTWGYEAASGGKSQVTITGIDALVSAGYYNTPLIVYYYYKSNGICKAALRASTLHNVGVADGSSIDSTGGYSFYLADNNVYPLSDIGYVRIVLGVSASGAITAEDVANLVINVPAYDTPATSAGWASTGAKHPYYLIDGIPSGGTTGQILTKTANGAAWQDNNAADSVFNIQSGQVLYAIGDSITYGYGVGGNSGSWVKHVIDRNGYDSTNSHNYGESGLGFCTNSTSNHSLADIIGGTNFFAGADIVTVALGINDWKDANATWSAFWTGMQYCFDKIRTDNPYCKIYFILPFNVSCLGTKDKFYGLGTIGDINLELYSVTLQTLINRIKAKFEEATFKAFNVHLIDMTECTAINRQNITTALSDGLHPTAATHIELGKEIARILSLSNAEYGQSDKISAFTNDSGYLTLATLPKYNGGVQ